MLYMVVEKFRNGDPAPVYQRLRDQGRQIPDEVRFVASWVTDDLRQCFQVMECTDPLLLERWTARWSDLVEFEILPVISSQEAQARVGLRQ